MIDRGSLLSLEAYARERSSFRAKVIEHKKHRTVALGGHVTLLFEDELTIRYQVQEMLHIERIFEEDGIRHELDAYNPLVPDGANWKATMLIEYPDAEERRRMLAQLKGIEHRVWVRVGGGGAAWTWARCACMSRRTRRGCAVRSMVWWSRWCPGRVMAPGTRSPSTRRWHGWPPARPRRRSRR